MADRRARPGTLTGLDLAVLGARVHTMVPGRPPAAALGVRDGRVVAVGDDHEVRVACTRRTRVLDGRGLTVVPGLTDAHAHPFWGVRATRGADLTGATGLPAALDLLAAEAARGDGGAWVLGHGLRREWFGDAVSARPLDAALPGRAVFATFHDGHGAVGSAEALRRAGVDGPRAFGDASEIVCRDGVPTGELREPSAMEAVRGAIPPLAPADRRARYRAVLEDMAAAGLTGVHVMDSDPDVLDDLEAMEAEAPLPVRVLVALWQQPGDGADAVEATRRDARRSGVRWRAPAAKFFLDGVVSSGTAWLGEPDVHGRCGGPFWQDPEDYRRRVHGLAEAGIGCVTHAIGDAAVAVALDVYAGAATPPAGTPRHRIEHLELVRPSDVRRLAELGVVAGMQPLHIDGGAASLVELLGAARAHRAWPCAELRDAGAVLALGSDWPVAPFPPLHGLAWARLRRAPGHRAGTPFGPGQVLDAVEALAGYTRGPAWAAGEEDVAGWIGPGARADLTLLAGDPLMGDADDLPGVAVRWTVVDGEVRDGGRGAGGDAG